MGLLIFVALLVVLDLAAWMWGRDSRDGRDRISVSPVPSDKDR